jgi:protein arginine kinase
MPSWFSHQGPESDVVISTRVRLARNLAHHHFPLHASLHERAKVFEEVTGAFMRSGLCDSFNSVNLCLLDKRQRQFMVEERLASIELAAADGDRGVIHDASRRISVMVNEEDHIRMQCTDAGLRPQDLWADLDGLDDAVGMELDYAFDNHRGFLTSRPSDAGTGLRVSFLLHLPALVLAGAVDEVLNNASRMGIATRGFLGGQSSVDGNLFQLANAAVMGSGESEFCDSTAAMMHTIIDNERKARERILSGSRNELTDKIFRAYGVLCNAALLGMEEFLNLSSVLRFGIESTLFDKCTIEDLNRLTLFVLPAHLQTYLQKDLDSDGIMAARAGLVKSFFTRGMELQGGGS